MVAELMGKAEAGALPIGWRTVTFGDVVRQTKVDANPESSGLERYIAGEHMGTDDLHLRSWGTIGEGYLGPAFRRKFVRGQVLYGSRRTYLRKVAVADFDGICANTTFVLEPSGDDLIADLLPFIMQTDAFNEHAVKQSRGSVNPYVNFRDIAWYAFPLPPKEEQRRIADILWAADAAVERWREAQLALHAARARVEGRLFADSDDDDRYATYSLAEVVEYASDGPFGSKLKTEHYSHEGARVIRLQNLGDSEFFDDDRAFVPLGYFAASVARYQVKPGDVLVAGLGDETNPVGRACRAPTALGPAVNKADCFCIRGKPGVIDNAYLCLALNSAPVRSQILQKAQGTTRLRVNVSNLKTVKFQVPPLGRQEAVLALLKPFDHAADQVGSSTITLARMAVLAREELLSGRNHV